MGMLVSDFCFDFGLLPLCKAMSQPLRLHKNLDIKIGVS